jgi:hypothetical protein
MDALADLSLSNGVNKQRLLRVYLKLLSEKKRRRAKPDSRHRDYGHIERFFVSLSILSPFPIVVVVKKNQHRSLRNIRDLRVSGVTYVICFRLLLLLDW